jgi:hypothetical protein
MVARSDQTFLPDGFLSAHDFCFLNHDILVELLDSAEKAGVLQLTIPFRDDADRTALERAEHPLDWLAQTGRAEERDEVIRRAVFLPLISDLLHFIYEALETSRKAKLNVTYALLRKPLQESLFIFERMALDREAFVRDLERNPGQLHSQTAGGVDVHADRIRGVLEIIGEGERFDAGYLAQLRYDKTSEDSFDGVSNQAVHLITTHPAIRTDPLNMNFIFSDWDSKLSQWDYLYSRLPYVLMYSRRLIEHVSSLLSTTEPVYLANIERRLNAAALIWGSNVPRDYQYIPLKDFLTSTAARLKEQCNADGWTDVSVSDLDVLSRSWGPPTLWQKVRRSLRRAVGGG